jgi:hypothetical protein
MHKRGVIVLLVATAAFAAGISLIDSRLTVSPKVTRLEPDTAKPGDCGYRSRSVPWHRAR